MTGNFPQAFSHVALATSVMTLARGVDAREVRRGADLA
jgi:hypothetical protein